MHMKVEKQRTLEPLRELDKETYLDALKSKNVNQYENEIALLKDELSIPVEIMELPYQAQSMLSFYNDKAWINKETGSKTYNDIVESYIASLEDSDWIETIFEKIPVYDENGNETGYRTLPNPEKKHQYMLLKQKAISYWNNNNLSQMVEIFKKLMLGGRKQEDMLKDAIIDDALYHPDDNYRLRSRNQAIKVMGMDKNVQVLGQDVWLKGGGRDFGKHASEKLGISSLDLTKYIEDDKDD